MRRIVSACFVLSVAAAGLAIPAEAQAQYAQQRVAEGAQTWGQDGWCYVVQRGRWVRTSYFRRFPAPGNYNVFDIYQNGRFVRRVGGARQVSAAEIELQRLVNQLNQETAAARRAQVPAASGRLIPGTPGTIGGGYDGGLTKTIELGHVPTDKLDEYIGRRSQGNIGAARIRTAPVCTARDRIHNVPGCPKI
jgi:hypothetical protein